MAWEGNAYGNGNGHDKDDKNHKNVDNGSVKRLLLLDAFGALGAQPNGAGEPHEEDRALPRLELPRRRALEVATGAGAAAVGSLRFRPPGANYSVELWLERRPCSQRMGFACKRRLFTAADAEAASVAVSSLAPRFWLGARTTGALQPPEATVSRLNGSAAAAAAVGNYAAWADGLPSGTQGLGVYALANAYTVGNVSTAVLEWHEAPPTKSMSYVCKKAMPSLEFGIALEVGRVQLIALYATVPYTEAGDSCKATGAALANVSAAAVTNGSQEVVGALRAALVRLALQARSGSSFWVAGGGSSGGQCPAMLGGWGDLDQAPGTMEQRPCGESLPVLCERDLPAALRSDFTAAMGPDTLLLFTDSLTRPDAAARCSATGGRLLVASSSAELRMAAAVLLPAAAAAGVQRVWLGLARVGDAPPRPPPGPVGLLSPPPGAPPPPLVLVPVIAAEVAASQTSAVAVLRAAVRVDGVPTSAVGSTPGQALSRSLQTRLANAVAAQLETAAKGRVAASSTRVAPLLSTRLPGTNTSDATASAAVLVYLQVSALSPAPWVSSDFLEAVLSSAAVSAALPPGYSASLHSAEAADRQAPAGYAPAYDTAPPQLRLVGDSELTVAVLDSYEDSGAVCSDSAEGALTDAALLTVGLPLSAEQATPQDTPALVLYGCADAAGNVAAPVVRRVTVYDPCQEQGEATCKDTGACSLAGSCKVLLPSANSISTKSIPSPATALRSAAVVDRTPPVIAILDPSPAYLPGVDYSTGASGTARASGRITWVLANTEFSDPGATALDDVDGDVSASLARQYPAEGPLDTRVPRSDSDPYLITYIATDSAGNRAVAFRRVYVVCPQGERVCDADETIDGTVACSSGGGICGVPGVGSGSQFRWQDLNTPPELKLGGDALVAMVADGEGGYAPCTRQSGFQDLCDPGATATDAEDGNLGPLVRACGALFGGSSGYGGSLAACGLNTAVPGDYVINFTVVDSGGASAWAARTLRVCPRDEVVCDDLSCSTDGVCSLLTGLNGGGDSASGLASIVSTIADFPTLSLLENDVVRGSVQLPRGRSYRLCHADQRATAEAPCDPGVYAVNRLGANITNQVYACPPDACFLDGIACSGHEFWKKDLAGCVSPVAAEGSTQEIRFVVFDRWARLPRVTASRLVSIVSPCSRAGEVYCEEDGKCGTVACDVRKTLGGGDAAAAALAALPPVLLLVDGSRIGPDMSAAVNVASLTNATTLTSLMNSSSGALLNAVQQLVLPYGLRAPYSLLPCASVSQMTGCGAVAVDAADGDLTPSIKAYPACPAEAVGETGTSGSCAMCSVEALTAGTCGPGVYAIRYSVSDSGSNAASLLRLVTVEERAVLDLAFTFSATLPLSPAAVAVPPPPPALGVGADEGAAGGAAPQAALAASASTAAAAFAARLQHNQSVQAQVVAAYLPAMGVSPAAVRRTNITRVTQVSAAVTAAGTAVSNIDDQSKARDAAVADAYASLQDLAASAVADASVKADTVLRLVMATLAAQNASAASMDAAALLLTLALQEAQESARRANLTAEIIASGLDDSYYGAEELQQLNDCLTARGEYLLDDFATVAPARTVGASGSRVVAGLFLHQRRIPAASLQDLYGGCASDDRFPQRLAAECGPGYSRTVGGPGQQGPSVGGIGVDPVFNRRSQLYSSDLAARIGDYYNATPGSGEVNKNGAPYGFFPSPVSLPGLGSDAYPVLFDTSLTEKRALQALLALSEGAYLDRAMTESLSAQLVSYSPDLRVFGFWRGEFRWGAEGAVRATLRTRGLPAIDWRASAKSGKMDDIAIDLALVALVLAYCLTTVYDVVMSVREQRARARAARQLAKMVSRGVQVTSGDGHLTSLLSIRKYRARMTLFWGIYETALSGIMAACLGLLFSYSRHVASGAPRQPRYDVYDADGYAQARYFMLRRDASAAAAALNASANAPLAGEPGRWSLPEDAGPLTQLADMYNQAIVLILLILRLVHRLSFQPRLSIISGTLARMIPDLASLVVILVVVLVMLSAVLVTMWGSQVAELSNMASAVEWMVAYFFSGMGMSGGNQIISDLIERASVTNDAYVFMAWMFGLAGPLVLVFILPQFLMALLAWPFCELKRLFRRAPHNKAIALLIERLTARQRSAGAMAALRRSFAASFSTADTMRRNLQRSFTAARRADVAYRTMVVDAGGKQLSAPHLEELLRSLRMKALPDTRVPTHGSALHSGGGLIRSWLHPRSGGNQLAAAPRAATGPLGGQGATAVTIRSSEDGGQPSGAVVLEHMVAAQLVRRLGEMGWSTKRPAPPDASPSDAAAAASSRCGDLSPGSRVGSLSVPASLLRIHTHAGGPCSQDSRAAARRSIESLDPLVAAAAVISSATAAALSAKESRRSFQLPAAIIPALGGAAPEDRVQALTPGDLAKADGDSRPHDSGASSGGKTLSPRGDAEASAAAGLQAAPLAPSPQLFAMPTPAATKSRRTRLSSVTFGEDPNESEPPASSQPALTDWATLPGGLPGAPAAPDARVVSPGVTQNSAGASGSSSGAVDGSVRGRLATPLAGAAAQRQAVPGLLSPRPDLSTSASTVNRRASMDIAIVRGLRPAATMSVTRWQPGGMPLRRSTHTEGLIDGDVEAESIAEEVPRRG
ncbi:hypothetical protein GPECTOR_7g1315 [Gonium pectorale]|uniref:Polycystin cation channel PKD1/PKD2 domain-containing protein n=1 Tax=Gonium pectorale TaxID=33097 RepID=A0A150GU74_GONPE|nr:hypothetical protein GPECTOR_7g1315 [Gonium pectorale]|eukprot:KXZ53417.1 hypothetical protein GPECTOR_7g1315 [Gonium pectorale]